MIGRTTQYELELDLLDWGEHYPTGAILYRGTSTDKKIVLSDYCDNVIEFKSFIDRIFDLKQFNGNNTSITIKVDPWDITENINTIISDILNYYNEKMESINDE